MVLSRENFHQPLEAVTFLSSLLSSPIETSFPRTFLLASQLSEERRLVGFREQTFRPELIKRTVLEGGRTVLAAQLVMR